MQIDWLTVVAQIVNFLILVWLLKHFLYQPVINAMDRREQRIAERLHNAELREQTAVDTTQDYQRKIEALEQDRDAQMEKAKEAAESERRELLDEARSEVAEKRSHWQRQVAEEKQDFLRSLKIQAAESIQKIARRALADLADAELEEQIIQSFIQRLSTLDKTSCQAIAAAAEPIRVTTSFELDSSIRGRLTRAVHEHIGDHNEVVYSESPDPLCGIELTVSGRRLSWTLADYLEALEQRMQEQLETTRGTGG
jgi:F-type H+-transporting ATPase subunit b